MRNKPLLTALVAGAAMSAAAAFSQTAPTVPVPAGAPVAAAGTVVLKYRDPLLPLSIGEMSDLQARKLDDDFLKKLGYTTEVPVAASAGKVGAATAGAMPKPMATVAALGIYGLVIAPRADVAINGAVYSVKGGESFPGGIVISSVTQSAVEVTVKVQSKKKGRASAKVATHTISVGDMLEFPL